MKNTGKLFNSMFLEFKEHVGHNIKIIDVLGDKPGAEIGSKVMLICLDCNKEIIAVQKQEEEKV
jgi:uncharacterized protein with PIN domain